MAEFHLQHTIRMPDASNLLQGLEISNLLIRMLGTTEQQPERGPDKGKECVNVHTTWTLYNVLLSSLQFKGSFREVRCVLISWNKIIHFTSLQYTKLVNSGDGGWGGVSQDKSKLFISELFNRNMHWELQFNCEISRDPTKICDV